MLGENVVTEARPALSVDPSGGPRPQCERRGRPSAILELFPGLVEVMRPGLMYIGIHDRLVLSYAKVFCPGYLEERLERSRPGPPDLGAAVFVRESLRTLKPYELARIFSIYCCIFDWGLGLGAPRCGKGVLPDPCVTVAVARRRGLGICSINLFRSMMLLWGHRLRWVYTTRITDLVSACLLPCVRRRERRSPSR